MGAGERDSYCIIARLSPDAATLFSTKLALHFGMTPNPTKTRTLSPSHCIEVGASTWNPSETSIRCRYEDPESGRFSPHGSSEIPLEDLQHVMEVAAENDLLDVATCAKIIEAIARSIQRQVR